MNYKKESRQYCHFGTILRYVVVILTFVCLSATTGSCKQVIEGDSIFLNITVDEQNSVKTDTTVNFSEEECTVLRCASFSVEEDRINIRVSKSKNMKAESLIFIQPEHSENNSDYVQIVNVPIIGKEYEYDIGASKPYLVTTISLDAVISEYGIPYIDWQMGACSSEEVFPCCE